MRNSAFSLLFFIAFNWFLVSDRRWEISLFCLLTRIFFAVQFYLSLPFSSLAFFSQKTLRQIPAEQQGCTSECTQVFPCLWPFKAFELWFKCLCCIIWMQHIQIFKCLVALSGYSHELPHIWPALQAAQGLQGRTAKGSVGWRCSCASPHVQKAEICNICLQSPGAAVCRCCCLPVPSAVSYSTFWRESYSSLCSFPNITYKP